MKFTTESGSKYEINKDEIKVRRIASERNMRKDEEWVGMLTLPTVEVGQPVRMILEPLNAGSFFTFRTTSPVATIDSTD